MNNSLGGGGGGQGAIILLLFTCAVGGGVAMYVLYTSSDTPSSKGAGQGKSKGGATSIAN